MSGLLLVVAYALATMAMGWWGLPVAAAIWGFGVPQKKSALISAGASVIAWGVLLLITTWHAPVGELLRILSDVFRLPAPGVIVMELVFPAALAWSATEVFAAVRLRVAAP